MPEGDTVFRAAAELRRALAGRVLVRSDFQVPRYATADLSGQVVTEVVPRGKHLLIRTDGGLSVHTHLKMEGRWRVRPATEHSGDSYRIRLVLANAQWQAVGYDLGKAELLSTDREQQVTGHLGPDLLGPDWDRAEAARRLRGDPDRAVGEALLDQQNLAGIGNVFAAEILFLRGVDPWRPVARGSTCGCTGGRESPAAAAKPASGRVNRALLVKSGSGTGARPARARATVSLSGCDWAARRPLAGSRCGTRRRSAPGAAR
jgi:formamidopyrimidine-DNA glycosylase